MTAINEEFLNTIHSSLCIRFGTTAPYAISAVRAQRIGFASIPCVVVSVTVPERAFDDLVPITRQRVSLELESRGWSLDDLVFRPSVLRGRRRKFRDENESSESHGRDKFGVEHEFHFEMKPELARATFTGGGSFKQLPTKGETT